MFGKGDMGQLGQGLNQDELLPYFISKIPEKVSELACGEEHTTVLTKTGEVYSMGSNRSG